MRTILFIIFLTLSFRHAAAQSKTDSLSALTNSKNSPEEKVAIPFELNVYGQASRHHLLDTSLFAKAIKKEISAKRVWYSASWFFLNSLWKQNEGQTIYDYHDFQHPLWKGRWFRYKEGIPNKKDIKSLLEFSKVSLVHEADNGAELSEIYENNVYSNISGTAFLSLSLSQLKWPHEVLNYNHHLFIIILSGEEKLILDCSQPDKLWKVTNKKSDYLNFLFSKNYIGKETDLLKLIESSEKTTYNQLVSLQKMAEADKLAKSDPAEAFYRMEVAHFFWPNPETKAQLIATSKNLYQSDLAKNDWNKVYGLLSYSRLTGDQSLEIKKRFNSILGLAFIHYSENEPLTLGYPVSMSIHQKNSYSFDQVLQKDTMNRMAAFDYNTYLHFDIFEPKTRGLFHSLSFTDTRERSDTDYQFYVDALYTTEYLDSTKQSISALYDLNLKNHLHFDDLPYLLKTHYQHGALTKDAYHEMCTIFYLSFLDHNAPKNISNANQISTSSISYSVFQKTLSEHLVFVQNPFLRTKAREYIKRMESIYKDKFIPDWEDLERIAKICEMETNFDAYEKMSTSNKAQDIIRRLNLMKATDEK